MVGLAQALVETMLVPFLVARERRIKGIMVVQTPPVVMSVAVVAVAQGDRVATHHLRQQAAPELG
tara:strand:- start:166 stop:360 length:195 start_codon:yes stop_codon:yes gene_type:complete